MTNLTVYKQKGRKNQYAHESKPVATVSLPVKVLFMISLPLSLFVPVIGAMALAGDFDYDLLPWCTTL